MCLQIFNEVDADGSGYITPDEVVIGFKKMGTTLSLDDAKAIVNEADTDKDGRISYTGNYKDVYTTAVYSLRVKLARLHE